MAFLFNNQTSNANSDAIDWTGGVGTFYVQGTFGSATVTLQASFDGGTTWIALDNAAITAAKALNFELGRVKLRAALTGATGTTSITAGI